jgi:F-type H+/Na+-transporting ATPase subunit alpha
MTNIGKVYSVSKIVVQIEGLSNAVLGQTVEFKDNIKGFIVSLNEDDVDVILLSDNYDNILEGDTVKINEQIFSIPTHKGLLGRIINSLGEPLDNRVLNTNKKNPIFFNKIPQIYERRMIDQQICTGIMSIDSMIPIGKGQNLSIFGDRKTGKTAIAIDTIINQKKINDAAGNNESQKLYCIYVTIGKRKKEIAEIVKKLKEHDAMKYTIIVMASASDPIGMQYIAPFSGCTIGEYFRDNKMNALIIYDDLTNHAIATRTMDRCLGIKGGIEDYSNRISHIYASLLEKSANMSVNRGSGSLTSLPIIETTNGAVQRYIPNNLISITDGQIFLETDLFNQGIRPAINVGLSVSRAGGYAQIKSMKQVAGNLKLELAQYRELAAFSQFASDLDEATRNQLNRGQRVVELLKQKRYNVLMIEEQIILIFALNQGYLDNLSLDNFQKSINNILSSFRKEKRILNSLNKTKNLDNSLKNRIIRQLEKNLN